MSQYENARQMHVMERMCATCPFRDQGWVEVRDLLTKRALREATPICHSTGRALSKKRLGPSRLCRGARDFQLTVFYRMGFIEAATDEAWNKKRKELGV